MANQSLLFTVLPRAVAVNNPTLPVSVFVSPRLSGADRLGAFPDWLDWTGQCAAKGLRLNLRCGTNTDAFEIDRTILRPDLWRAMFNRETYVNSHQFDNYTDRSVISYSTRTALSVLKATYQEAGVALALPDRAPEVGDGRQDHDYDDGRGNRRRWFLRSILDGLAINWNEEMGARLRDELRSLTKDLAERSVAPRYPSQWLASDGTFGVPPKDSGIDAKQLRGAVAQQFGIYSHMPQGDSLKDRPQDFETLMDFHQALSSLNSYPELLRALGIVFDLALPIDFVATTGVNVHGTLAVVDVSREWAIPTTTVPKAPPIATAYLHWHTTSPYFRLFTTAPAVMDGAFNLDILFGLLLLDPERYGLAQVDVESGMHKTTLLAEAWQDSRPGPARSDRPDVFDETTTLPSLRSGGFSIFADGRALRLMQSFARQKQLNDNLTGGVLTNKALFAEDLVQGYRVDVWDGAWRSLHQRHAHFEINGVRFDPPGSHGRIRSARGSATCSGSAS